MSGAQPLPGPSPTTGPGSRGPVPPAPRVRYAGPMACRGSASRGLLSAPPRGGEAHAGSPIPSLPSSPLAPGQPMHLRTDGQELPLHSHLLRTGAVRVEGGHPGRGRLAMVRQPFAGTGPWISLGGRFAPLSCRTMPRLCCSQQLVPAAVLRGRGVLTRCAPVGISQAHVLWGFNGWLGQFPLDAGARAAIWHCRQDDLSGCFRPVYSWASFSTCRL